MNDYPDMNIELSSHTDSRGSNIYNLKLSQRRADAAVAYILGKGISKSRITDSRIWANTACERLFRWCELYEKQHQENRRTEFKLSHAHPVPELKNRKRIISMYRLW